MTEQRDPSAAALKWAKAELDRIERQERPGLPIWANNPANVHDLAFMFDAFVSLIHPPGEVSEDDVKRVARAICRSDGHNPDEDWSLAYPNNSGSLSDPAWRHYEANARAAIAALLTPSEREALKEALRVLERIADHGEVLGPQVPGVAGRALDRIRASLGDQTS